MAKPGENTGNTDSKGADTSANGSTSKQELTHKARIVKKREYAIENAIILSTDDYEGFKLSLSVKGIPFDETLNMSKKEVLSKLTSKGIDVSDFTNGDLVEILDSASIIGALSIKNQGDTYIANAYSTVEAPDHTPERPSYRRVSESEVGSVMVVKARGVYLERDGMFMKFNRETIDRIEARRLAKEARALSMVNSF